MLLPQHPVRYVKMDHINKTALDNILYQILSTDVLIDPEAESDSTFCCVQMLVTFRGSYFKENAVYFSFDLVFILLANSSFGYKNFVLNKVVSQSPNTSSEMI